MDRELLERIALKTMSRRKSHLQRECGYIYYHGRRVAAMSLQLRQRLLPDLPEHDDCLYAGALFHDAAKGIEPHHETGAHLVPLLLQDACTSEELELVSDIVRLHNRRQDNALPDLVKIVQDADTLDHFGSNNIWLKFQYSAAQEENVFDALRLWQSEEHARYIQSSREGLNFELSRLIFDRKIEFERQFEQRFAAESCGELDF